MQIIEIPELVGRLRKNEGCDITIKFDAWRNVEDFAVQLSNRDGNFTPWIGLKAHDIEQSVRLVEALVEDIED